MIRAVLAAATVSIAAFAGAAAANATPEDDYLGVLSNTPGFTVNGFTGPMLTSAGNTVCTDLRAGMSPEDSAQKMLFYPGSSIGQTRLMVSAAQQTLCPDTVR